MMLDPQPASCFPSRVGGPAVFPRVAAPSAACPPHQLIQISFSFSLFKLFLGHKAIFLLPSRQKQRPLNLRKIHCSFELAAASFCNELGKSEAEVAYLICCFAVSQSRLTLCLHGLWHARLPCPSLSPGVCSNSCPSNHFMSVVAPFSSCPWSFPASGYFPVSWLFASSILCKVY